MTGQMDTNLEISPNFLRYFEYLQKIQNVESDDEREKMAKELGIEPPKSQKDLIFEFKKMFKTIEDNSRLQKKKKQKEIKLYEDFVKILESTNFQNQNPKIKELIQKEIGLISFLKKEQLFLNRIHLAMSSIGDLLSSIENKDEFQKEIENLTNELKTEGVL